MHLNSRNLKFLALITFVLMVFVNAMANILPINGVTTAAVSDSLPNLFAPAGVTFSIWGLIYLLLGAYTVYIFIRKSKSKEKEESFDQINKYFIASSIINAVWIFAWHFNFIWLTLLLMVGILFCLIKIADTINSAKLTKNEKLITKIPFGVYFGWITVATIANITAFLVSIGWNGFGIPDTTWMIIVLFTGVIIASLRAIKDKNMAYALVPVWAYIGIFIKHTSATGFNNMYPEVILAVAICIISLAVLNGYLLITKKAI